MIPVISQDSSAPSYLMGPVHTQRNCEPLLPFPTHSSEAKCVSNLLHSLFPGQYGMYHLPSDAVKDGQADTIRMGGEHRLVHSGGDGPRLDC